MIINKENCHKIRSSGSVNTPILTGKIKGVKSNYLNILGPSPIGLAGNPDEQSVFICLNGYGTISQGNNNYDIKELAVFIPEKGSETTFFTEDPNGLSVLQITYRLTPEDQDFLTHNNPTLPRIFPYSQCSMYLEKIKSPKTISRTLVHENLLPRFCMGSVESTGPDVVTPHCHPGLEQLFFGLKDNKTIVTADKAWTTFKEGDLLHVPLGSNHGVEVKEGNRMHYIWIDFFLTQEDAKHIKDNHVPLGEL